MKQSFDEREWQKKRNGFFSEGVKEIFSMNN